MATIDEIKQQAEAVKNATQVGENTAERVGGALAGLAEIAEQQDSKLRDLSGLISKNVIVKIDETSTIKGYTIKIDGTIAPDIIGWEYVLFYVAPNDKIKFKASGNFSNVISFYQPGKIPSADSYVEGMRSDGDGASSYKEYVSVSKGFYLAAIGWYRDYGEPKIEIERTNLIENFSKVVDDVNSEIKDINNGNLFNMEGHYISKFGDLYDDEEYCSTDFIFIDKNNDISIKNALTGPSSAIIAFYDKDKTCIEGSIITNKEEIHISKTDIPVEAVYFRSSTHKSSISKIIVKNNNVYSYNKLVDNVNKKVESVEQIIESFGYKKTENTIEVGLVNKEIYLDGSLRDSVQYVISKKINVSKSDIIKIKGSGFDTLMIAEYLMGHEPSSDSFIGGTACENRVVKEYSYTCKNNGYVLLCYAPVYFNATTYTHIIQGKVHELVEESDLYAHYLGINKPLNILIFGDSITDSANIEVSEESVNATTTKYNLPYDGNSYLKDGVTIKFSMWPALLRRQFNILDIRVYAKSGATYTNDEANTLFRQNLSEQIALAFNDIPNPNNVFITQGNFVPDIVIFALSTNDSNTPLDTYEEAMSKTIMNSDETAFDVDATLNNLDLSKFNQAVRYSFLKLKKKFPYALYFCIVPPQNTVYDIGETQKEKDLKRMAARYSINIINIAEESGIIRDLETSKTPGIYLKDGLHPNEKGQNLYTRAVVSAIRSKLVDMSYFNK